MVEEKVGSGATWRLRAAYFVATPFILGVHVICRLFGVRSLLEISGYKQPSLEQRFEMMRLMYLKDMQLLTAIDNDIANHPINEDGTRILSERGAKTIAIISMEARTILGSEGMPFPRRGQQERDAPAATSTDSNTKEESNGTP